MAMVWGVGGMDEIGKRIKKNKKNQIDKTSVC